MKQVSFSCVKGLFFYCSRSIVLRKEEEKEEIKIKICSFSIVVGLLY